MRSSQRNQLKLFSRDTVRVLPPWLPPAWTPGGGRGGRGPRLPSGADRGACAVGARCGAGHCACAPRPRPRGAPSKVTHAPAGGAEQRGGRHRKEKTELPGRGVGASPERQPCFPQRSRKPSLRPAQGGRGRRPSFRSPGQRSQSPVGARCPPPARLALRRRCRPPVAEEPAVLRPAIPLRGAPWHSPRPASRRRELAGNVSNAVTFPFLSLFIQEWANFLCNEPVGQCFRICRPGPVSVAYFAFFFFFQQPDKM